MFPRWLRSIRHVRRLPEVWNCSQAVRGWRHVTRAYLGWSAPDYPLEFHTRAGVRIRVHDFHELVTAWIVFCRREYHVPTDARVILDLGANYGAFTLFAAMQVPAARIIGLEPFPEMYRRLRENVAAHKLQDRVTCWRLAVASESGTRAFEADPALGAPSNYGLLPADTRGSNGHRAIHVPTVSWDDLLRRVRVECGVERLDLVKMDIEGAEHEILPHLTADVLSNVRAWQMEYHPDRPKRPLFDALERAGLHCVRDIPAGQDSGVAHFARDGGR